MIVLDTNVVSEAIKPSPQPAVQAWLDRQVAETLYLPSVTVAELLFGVSVLQAGRRKQALVEAVTGVLTLFQDRVLPFDVEAARHYAELAIKARASGRGFPTPDGYIAAIAASRGFIVATRDVAPFVAAGVTVISPWDA